MNWLAQMWDELVATSAWEAAAVVLALAYLLLAVRRSLWCWACAFASTAIYLVLMFRAQLYMQIALQAFYIAMAAYGYWEWRRGRDDSGQVTVTNWQWRTHAVVVSAIAAVAVVNGWLLAEYAADAAFPYTDAFVTWGSVVATFMVARRVRENWLYWIALDVLAAYLYFNRGLNLTGVLFLVYTGIAVQGYRSWKRDARTTAAEDSVTSIA